MGCCASSVSGDTRPSSDLDKSDKRDAGYLASDAKCPYAKFFTNEPVEMRDWSTDMTDGLEKEWKNMKCPFGPTENSHTWNAPKFSNGNTLGFVAGCVTIGEGKGEDLSKLPKEAREGLFKDAGKYPCVVRFSDIGPDDKPLTRMTRMSVQMYHPDSWCNEINWLTTETVDEFPVAPDFETCKSHVDPNPSTLEKMAKAARTLGVAVKSAPELSKQWNSGEVLGKRWYSCFPYALGTKKEASFKYRFVPLQDPLGDVGDTPAEALQSVRNYLRMRTARYSLDIQVGPAATDPKCIGKDSAYRWDDEWHTVGTLTLCEQDTDNLGFSVPLKKWLLERMKLTKEQEPYLHTMFQFHPVRTWDVHQPLGEAQQFRSHLYAYSAALRLKLLSGDAKVKPAVIPWTELGPAAKQTPSSGDDVAAIFQPDTSPLVDDDENLPPKYKEMDRYTKTVCTSVAKGVQKALTVPLDDKLLRTEDIDAFGDVPHTNIQVGKVTIKLLDEDDTFGAVDTKTWCLLRVLRSNLLFPIEDKPDIDCTIEEGDLILKAVGLKECLPKATHVWPDGISSDESFTRLHFTGAGALLLAPRRDDDPSETKFVVDTGLMKDLPIRPGFRKYGTCAHFDGDRKLVSIFDYSRCKMFTKADGDEWEAVKFAAKTSLATLATGGHHLLWSHFLVANVMGNAWTKNLPSKHPLRRLLAPFLFRTTYVNNRAKDSLLPEHSMFHHATAMTYEGVTAFVEVGASVCSFWQPLPETIESSAPELQHLAEAGHLPYFTHGKQLYDSFKKLCDAWIEATYPNDDALVKDTAAQTFWSELMASTAGLKYAVPRLDAKGKDDTRQHLARILAQFMFVVTGLHDYVGAVVEYATDVTRTGFRAREGKAQADLQSWLIASSLIATTSIRTPALLSSWPNFFDGTLHHDQAYTEIDEVGIWAKFLEDLKAVAAAQHQANKSLPHPLNNFNPEFLECAVSV